MIFSAADLKQLASLNIDPSNAERQLACLSAGQMAVTLERSCTIDDGIIQIPPQSYDFLHKAFSAAVESGRMRRFVPASGAASRMFSQLHAEASVFESCRAEEAGPDASQSELDLRQFLDNLASFAFYPDLQNALAEDGHDLQQLLAERNLDVIVRYLLEPSGLSYSRLPKGLLAFHSVADGARTPFIEHLSEAALLNGLQGVVSLHFTVSGEHLELFKAQFAAWRETLEAAYGCHFEVTYSTQKASTDTLSLDDSGQPLRSCDGTLALRPGGHGALIENLNDLAADIVLVRNIDNVVPDAHKEANLLWTKLLTGYLLTVQQEQYALLKALTDDPEDSMVRELVVCFLADRLQVEVSLFDSSNVLLEHLDRPIRVCGMVPNSGEPGGGPFWVRDAAGRVTKQIVEGAQIDKEDPSQAEHLAGSTHFNPVDMVCGVTDWRGNPYDLTRFVDEKAVIVTTKMQAGKELRVLELPGLWNGAMAGWHTLFVEVPAQAFNPVKTVFDLLRPAHQP